MLPEGVRLRDRIGHGEVVDDECWENSADSSGGGSIIAAASTLVFNIICLLLCRSAGDDCKSIAVGLNCLLYKTLFHPAVRLAQQIERSALALLDLPRCDPRSQLLPRETFLLGTGSNSSSIVCPTYDGDGEDILAGQCFCLVNTITDQLVASSSITDSTPIQGKSLMWIERLLSLDVRLYYPYSNRVDNLISLIPVPDIRT